MKLVVQRKAALDAFASVAPALAKNSPIAALQSALLVADESGVTLTGSNLEAAITRRVLGATVAEPGRVLLSDRFHTLLRTGSGEEMTLSSDGSSLVVKSKGSRHVMPVGDVDKYEVPPAFDADSYFRVAAEDLKSAISRTVIATTEKSSNYSLGGIKFEDEGGVLRMVAFDGNRLALVDVDAAAEGTPAVAESSVPARALRLLERILDDDAPAVDIAFGRNSASFRVDGSLVWCRLLHGTFPAYKRAFSMQWPDRAVLRASDLRDAVQEAAVMTGDESRGVTFTLERGTLRIAASTAEVGQSEVEREVAWGGEARAITLDARHALAPLQALSADDEVSVGVVSDQIPALFESGRNKHFVAPITIKKKGA